MHDYFDQFDSGDLQSMLDNHQYGHEISKVIMDILGGRNELLNA